jgi:molecular chaperone HtpG
MTDTDNLSKGPAETHSFQAEVAELLQLMVHSVYAETDIFLRELISNASDACDRLRYEAIAGPELIAGQASFAIRIKPDAAANTLTIADNGIGMDHGELIGNLGTIARSGTRAFVSKLSEAKEGTSLIGQFGVGFYSAFMVADRIEVLSRRAGQVEAWLWTSSVLLRTVTHGTWAMNFASPPIYASQPRTHSLARMRTLTGGFPLEARPFALCARQAGETRCATC